MKIEFTVRELREEEIGAAAALDAVIFPESPWGETAFADHFRNSFDHCFAAVRENGALIGFALLRTLDAGELLLIGTDPGFRRSGIGGALLEAVMERTRESGAASLLLEVRAQNAPAVSLYKRGGFRTILTRKGYYADPPDDALVMELKLTD